MNVKVTPSRLLKALEEASSSPDEPAAQPRWTFLSNHTHVLVCLAIDGDQRVRDVADRVGLTERAVQNILADLEKAGLIQRERVGRRNRYTLELDVPLRHPLEAEHTVGELLALLLPEARKAG